MASYPKRRGAQPAPKKKSNHVAVFGLLAVAIFTGGGLLAVLSKTQKQAEETRVAEVEQEQQANKPFADMPPEEHPSHKGAAGDPKRPFAELDVGAVGGIDAAAVSATWNSAKQLATEGEALFQEALAAKGNGETSLLNQRGAASQSKFDAALEMTALLEESLIAERGESDATVRALKRTRTQWFDRLRWLHKSIGR
jgi:hypothetical protein